MRSRLTALQRDENCGSHVAVTGTATSGAKPDMDVLTGRTILCALGALAAPVCGRSLDDGFQSGADILPDAIHLPKTGAKVRALERLTDRERRV
jgi:hypothetical protein